LNVCIKHRHRTSSSLILFQTAVSRQLCGSSGGALRVHYVDWQRLSELFCKPFAKITEIIALLVSLTGQFIDITNNNSFSK
jgi:hypothetical protein